MIANWRIFFWSTNYKGSYNLLQDIASLDSCNKILTANNLKGSSNKIIAVDDVNIYG